MIRLTLLGSFLGLSVLCCCCGGFVSTLGGQCFSCNGVGRTKCTFCETGTTDCPHCVNGERPGIGGPCSICNGKGVQKCAFCDGDGYKTCPFCNGTGRR